MFYILFILLTIFLQQLQFTNSSSSSNNSKVTNNAASSILNLSHASDEYIYNLKHLLAEILLATHLKRCFVVITDDFYHVLYEEYFFLKQHDLHTHYYIKVNEGEDLLAPHYQTVRVLKEVHASNCNLHFITLLNGLQVKRFLRFIEKNRILNVRNKFVFLYDARVLEADMLYIWSNMISSIFLKRQLGNSFTISTISYPNILSGIVVKKQLMKWTLGKRVKNVILFPDKSSNLKGIELPVAVFEHVPMVVKHSDNTFVGLEIEIVQAIGAVLNFSAKYYESHDSETEHWGRELLNGSFTGFIGQVTNRTARLAIGDLHPFRLYAPVMDLSWPHSYDCLTFLTPESVQNTAWRTLIQPFSGSMWTGVLLSLFIVGTIFYMISFLHALLFYRKLSLCHFFTLLRKQQKSATTKFDERTFRDARFRADLQRLQIQLKDEDIFDNYNNCLLFTYSMLMYVALPRMPRNWPLRVLTGWYWLYCILVTVTYRASFTAILANPAPRITIDTLAELAKSHITAISWIKENKKFFDDAFDEGAQKIGINMEIIEDISSVTDRIAEGRYAYYDNEYFLRHLRVTSTKRRADVGERNENLHIMRDCIIKMPVTIGLEKNSALKPLIDKYIKRLTEGGLIAKWRKDAIKDLPAEEMAPPEALMNLGKIWSAFVALSIGYFLGVCAICAEHLHFKYVVRKHPLYDVYNPNLYYNFKRKFPHL